jgi:tyrosyl-tRNA synthetase
LVTGADGNKLGKTERGTIWLDAKKTSPYRYYQFWLNQGDTEAVDCLKYFTWLTQVEIADLAHQTTEHPERREAQRTLASEMTRMTHGETALAKALQASKVLFGGEIAGLDASDIQDIFADVPSSEVAKSRFEGEGVSVVDILDETEMTRSKGEARRLLKSGGIYVNNVQVESDDAALTLSDAIEGGFIVLRRGKKRYHLVRVLS